MSQGGYSLMELMVVVTIIGIVAAAAAPQYTRTVEQARCDQAVETLRSLWSAQRLHRLEHGTYAVSIKALDDAGLIDRGIDRADAPFAYTLLGSADTFRIEARRRGTAWTGTFSIDQSAELAGEVEDRGGNRVTP